MFGTVHIWALIASAVLIALGILFTRRLSLDTVTKIMFGIGIVSEIVKVFTYTVWNEAKLGGYLPKTDLPFHLCSIQIVFLAILVFSQNKRLHRLLYSFMLPSCLIGALGALLIPASSPVSRLCVITFQYFIYHSALIVFAVKLFTAKELRFTVKDYFACLGMLVFIMFIAIYINSILYAKEYSLVVENGEARLAESLNKVNFMYVVDPPVAGLPFLNKNNGWLSYILRYGAVCVTAVTLVYIKPIIRAITAHFKKQSQNQ